MPFDMTHVPIHDSMNFRQPPEGAAFIPLVLDFTNATGQGSWDIDLSQLQQQNRFTMLQSIYANLDGVTGPVVITINDALQIITIKPNQAGYFPVLANNPTKMNISAVNANAVLRFHLCNSPIPGVVWATQ